MPAELLHALAVALATHGTRGLARLAQVSPAYIHQVKHGTTPPSPKLLAYLGWERITFYRRIEP